MKKLLIGGLIAAALVLGATVPLDARQFTAQIQAALQTLGIWPYDGSYADGEVPEWSAAQNKFVAGSGGGGGAPEDATYITQIPNATLTNEQALSALASGLMYSTTATGVVSTLTSSTVGQVLRVTGANTFAFGAVDLADGDAITGNLPVANLNSGTGAGATTFWRGDGSWATVNATFPTACAGISGIAVTATPTVLGCVGGSAIWTAAAASFTTTQPVGIGVTPPVEQLQVFASGTAGVFVNWAADESLIFAGDSGQGPYVASHTRSNGNSFGNTVAMKLNFGAAGLLVRASPATAVGAARTFTTYATFGPTGGLTMALSGLGTTSTDELVLSNTTAATGGATVQISGRSRWAGAGWDTDDGVSRTVSFITEVLPTSGTSVSGSWKLASIGPVSGALNYILAASDSGLTITGIGVVTGKMQVNGGANGADISLKASGNGLGFDLVGSGVAAAIVGMRQQADGTNGGYIFARDAAGGVDTVFFNGSAALGGTVGHFSTLATNDDPAWNFSQGRVAPTDATVTTINTIAIPASTTVGISCEIINRRTGGVAGTAEDGAYYVLKVVLKNVAGTATEIAAETVTVVGESQAAWTVTAAPSGGNELIQVTGAVDNNITWHSHCSTYAVSS